MLSVVRISEALSAIDQPWQPRVVGAVNEFHVKLVKLHGSFQWHHHETEDEMFLVVRGTLRMNYRHSGGEAFVEVRPGEFIIVPHGMEHLPVAEEPVEVMLFEPKTTVNTGTEINERTYVDR